MITQVQISWIAGILEGEGYFTFTKDSAMIRLSMTDVDIVTRIRDIIAPGRSIGINYSKKFTKKGILEKPMYYFSVCGSQAIQWMMTIYPLMGIRRQQKIREILVIWKNRSITNPKHVYGHNNREFGEFLQSLDKIERDLAQILKRAGKSQIEIIACLAKIKKEENNAATVQ